MTFFRAGSAPDLIYCHINESQDPQVREAKEYMERTWEAYRDYVDPRLPERALTEFHACFWEIYLAAALLRLGLPITREADRRHPKNHGPDIQVGNVQAWIEAKAVEQGNGPDPVPDWCFGEGREVPDDEIKLRLSDALAVKLEAYRKWLEKGVVLDSQPFVIAVNAGLLPYVHAESTIPRIITVLFPFGFEAVPFDLSANKAGDRFFTYSAHIQKKSGAKVCTSYFDQEETKGISGVLYSAANAVNRPDVPGREFIFVHNPKASSPLPRGFVPIGRECWVEGTELVIKAHPVLARGQTEFQVNM